MVGYALSGFVDGFFRGREMKNSWEDRKLDRERQTRLDKMAEERHGAIMAQYGREAADWDRENRRREAELGVFDRAANAALAGAAADGEGEGSSGPSPSESRAGELGVTLPTVLKAPQSRFADVMGRTTPYDDLAARAKAQGQTSARRAPDAAPGPVVAGHNMPGSTRMDPRDVGTSMLRTGRPELIVPMMMPPGNQGMGVAPQVAPEAGPMRRLQDGTIVAPAPSAAIADELYQQGPVGARYIPPDRQVAPFPQPSTPPSVDPSRAAVEARAREAAAAELDRRQRAGQPDYSHQFLQPGGLGADIAEVGRRVPRALGGVAEQAANAVNAVVNPYVRYATGYEFPTSSPQAAPAPNAPAAAATPPATTAPAAAPQLDPANPIPPMLAAVPEGATPEEALAATAAAETVNAQVSAPTSDAARVAAASLGVDPGDKVTPAQYERASQSFIDRYLEVGAPMVIEHYLRTGQTEKAQKFMEFVDSVQTRENMRDYGKAMAAMAVGNVDKAAVSLMDAMERMDYIDEGTELVRDKSGVMRDKDGNAIGMKLVFKDAKSGTTFEQTFENMEDALSFGMILMDPQETFERQEALAAEQREAALGLQEEILKLEAERRKAIDEAALEILEASKDTMGNVTMTYAQARREAEQGMRADSSVPAGPINPERDPETVYRE